MLAPFWHFPRRIRKYVYLSTLTSCCTRTLLLFSGKSRSNSPPSKSSFLQKDVLGPNPQIPLTSEPGSEKPGDPESISPFPTWESFSFLCLHFIISKRFH